MPDRPSALHIDYAPAPGQLLEETLEVNELSARELARRCGRSPKLITEIVSGKAALEPETALQFERVLGIEASIWLGMEAEYRLNLARQAEQVTLTKSILWLKSFPLVDLYGRKILSSKQASAELVGELLRFFGVASVEACNEQCESIGLSYRHSATFDTDRHALFAWLRMGELEADRVPCADFDRAKLLNALARVRELTVKEDVRSFLPQVTKALAAAGVAFVVIKPLGKMALSGVSRWLTPRKAVIQQTLRHMSDDHFWFTLFHEAAHILLHSRKTVFVDGRDASDGSQEEDEANKWATEFLISRQALAEFCAAEVFSDRSVRQFASEQGIAPGIVVGQLQKIKKIPYSHLNQLKVRFEGAD